MYSDKMVRQNQRSQIEALLAAARHMDMSHTECTYCGGSFARENLERITASTGSVSSEQTKKSKTYDKTTYTTITQYQDLKKHSIYVCQQCKKLLRQDTAIGAIGYIGLALFGVVLLVVMVSTSSNSGAFAFIAFLILVGLVMYALNNPGSALMDVLNLFSVAKTVERFAADVRNKIENDGKSYRGLYGAYNNNPLTDEKMEQIIQNYVENGFWDPPVFDPITYEQKKLVQPVEE